LLNKLQKLSESGFTELKNFYEYNAFILINSDNPVNPDSDSLCNSESWGHSENLDEMTSYHLRDNALKELQQQVN